MRRWPSSSHWQRYPTRESIEEAIRSHPFGFGVGLGWGLGRAVIPNIIVVCEFCVWANDCLEFRVWVWVVIGTVVRVVGADCKMSS